MGSAGGTGVTTGSYGMGGALYANRFFASSTTRRSRALCASITCVGTRCARRGSFMPRTPLGRFLWYLCAYACIMRQPRLMMR